MKKVLVLILISVVSNNIVCSESIADKLMQAGLLATAAGVAGLGAYKGGELVANNCSSSTTTVCAAVGGAIATCRAVQFANRSNRFSKQFTGHPFLPNACALIVGGGIARGAIAACLSLSEEARQPFRFWSTVAIGTGALCGLNYVVNTFQSDKDSHP